MNFRRLWISPVVAVTLSVAAQFVARAEDAPPSVPDSAKPAPGPVITAAPQTNTTTLSPTDAPKTDKAEKAEKAEKEQATESSSAPQAPVAAPGSLPTVSLPVVTPAQPADKAAGPSLTPIAEPPTLKEPEFAKPITATESTPKPSSDLKLHLKPTETPKSTSQKPTTTAKPADKPIAKPAPAPAVIKPRDPLLDLVDRAILETSRRRLTAGVHTPWQIVHGILAYRWEFKLINPLDAKDISGIEWMFSGQYHDNEALWLSTPWGGRGHPYTRPYAFEGHPTQFMGYMTMANIPLEYEVQTPERVLKIRDIINDAKMSVKEGPEVTWTLWAVSHYEEPDAQWTNSQGEPWSIERMVKIQVEEPVTQGACGGTHGLFALAYSRNIFLSIRGNKLRGVWQESDTKIKKYILVSQAYQNADGSLSANYFQGPGYSQDFVKRITTSGHQLEWLMVAMPQSQLSKPWIRNAIQCVAQELIDNRRTPSDCGPMYHAVNALTIYRQRMLRGQYMIPKRNSPIKITERTFKNQIIPQQTPVQAAIPPDQLNQNNDNKDHKRERRRRF